MNDAPNPGIDPTPAGAPAATVTVTTVTPTPTPAPVYTTSQIEAAVSALMKDAVADIPTIKQVVADIKAKGIAGALADASVIQAAAKPLISDVEAAIPIAKAGVKTSEFWLVVGGVVVVGVCALTGHPLPVTETTAVSGLIAVYTAVRGIVKSKA